MIRNFQTNYQSRAGAVDKLIVVVEPWRRAVETARRIKELAHDIGLQNVAVVGNKIRSQSEKEFIVSSLPGFNFLGFIPYDQALVDADVAYLSPLDASQQITSEVRNICQALLSTAQVPGKTR